MVSSRVGWLCLSCGHTEQVNPASVSVTPPPLSPPSSAINPSTLPIDKVAVPVVEPAPVPSTPEPIEAPVIFPVPPIESKVLSPTIPETHPHPHTGRWVAVVAVLALIAAGASYWLFFSPSSPLVHQVVNTPIPSTVSETLNSPAAGISPSVSPAASNTPSPSASPVAAGDAGSRDAQRQQDVANYAAAYKTQSSNGYYPVKPPSVTLVAKDPTTGVSYVVQTTAATAPGQIYYDAGGKCGTAGITPGSAGTHYLSLTLQLESSTVPYCLDVK
jgi:hypothetical protein